MSDQEQFSWSDTYKIKGADLLHPKPVDFPISMFDTVYNRLLAACDSFGVGPSEYIQKAVIAQLKKDKQWY